MNLQQLARMSGLVVIIGTWLVLEKINQSSEFAGVGSTVQVGFNYRSLACIKIDFKNSELAGVEAVVEVGVYYRGVASLGAHVQ